MATRGKGTPPNNRHTGVYWLVAITAGILTMSVRRFIFPDARWWSLVMVGLLVACLAAYLWRAWHTKS
jgi:hypothetical protein